MFILVLRLVEPLFCPKFPMAFYWLEIGFYPENAILAAPLKSDYARLLFWEYFWWSCVFVRVYKGIPLTSDDIE